MPRKKTNEEFIEELKLKNPTIIVLDTYKKSSIKVHCKCLIDGYEWYATPNSLLRGSGCPKCCNRERYDNESIRERLKESNPNIELIGDFVNVNTKMKCKCLIDGYIWESRPCDILHGHGCPKCNKCQRYTTKEFVEELSKINNDIEIIGEYVNANTYIKCRCKKDGYIWNAKPKNLLSGYGCSKCAMSKGEQKIKSILDEAGIEYVHQYKFDDLYGTKNGLLSYDFFLLKYNMLIEYQGNFHDGTARIQTMEEYKIQQEHDKRKYNYAISHNFEILEIWYYDFNNISQILHEKLHINNSKKSA